MGIVFIALKSHFCAEDQMRKHALMCEDAIVKNDANKMVDHTTAIARLANRVLQVAKQEADNSEDPVFISDINRAADQVQTGKGFILSNCMEDYLVIVLTHVCCCILSCGPDGPGCKGGSSGYAEYFGSVQLARVQ
jgi:hypothetical protein